MMHSHHAAQDTRGGRGDRRRGAFTLVEMMLALVSTALIGLAIAAMLTAVSYGTQASKDARTLVVKAKAVNSRISAAVRQGAVVLAANTTDDDGDDWIVLWTPGADAQATAPKTSELHRIEFNSTARTIRSYRNIEPDVDDTYALGDNFQTISNSLVNDGTWLAQIWGTDVRDVEIRLDSPLVQDTRLVSYRVVLGAGDLTETAVSAAALRNRGIAIGE